MNLKRSSSSIEEPPQSRPRANSSIPQPLINGVSDGLLFFGLINSKGRVFIPSTKNYFGGIKVSRVLCDSGCSSLLIPIESSESLAFIFNIFSNPRKYEMTISQSRGVGGQSLTLIVKYHTNKERFAIKLAEDILGKGVSRVDVDYLRFALSTEDISEILAKKQYASRFTNPHQLLLNQYKCIDFPRRTHVLLGQLVLRRFSAMKHKDCEIYFNAAEFPFPAALGDLEEMIWNLTKDVKEALPHHFNDWEDDNFHFLDTEDFFSKENFSDSV